MPSERKTHALPEVQDFYKTLPFNFHQDVSKAVDSVLSNPLRSYPDLDVYLSEIGGCEVLELGCGAGWASNAMALHYGCRVTAVDFTKAAIERAQDVSEALGCADRTEFIHGDLYQFARDSLYDVVFSVGVLHHTANCRAGVELAARFVRPGGVLFLGLYHLYGRRPFLNHFKQITAEQGEDAAFGAFCTSTGQNTDQTHLRSWFRDQVLHPFETQHTLEDVLDWTGDLGLTLETTSINRLEPLPDRAKLFALERELETLSVERNVKEGAYYPGFFTAMLRNGVEDPP